MVQTTARTDLTGASHEPAHGRETEWSRRFAALTLAWLAFLTLSGLAVWLLPFSAPIQWTVILHTGIGVVFLGPVLVYQWEHLRAYWARPGGAVKWMGYLATLATSIALGSGLVLTVQAIWGSRISYAWDRVHLVSTFALLAFAAPHVVVTLVRDRAAALKLGLEALRAAAARTVGRTAVGTLLMLVPVGVLWAVYPGDRLRHEFPPDYSWKYGASRPFAPSLATTATGHALESRTLAGSESCGTTGCHEQIAAGVAGQRPPLGGHGPGLPADSGGDGETERPRVDPVLRWLPRPDLALLGHQEHLHRGPDRASPATRRASRAWPATPSARPTSRATPTTWSREPKRYLFELREGPAARGLRDFLIRAYPRQHIADLSKRLFKTPEYCAACHKQFIDQEVNKVGWVQLQNQYDNWRKSRWNHPGDAARTIECRECHMPLTASHDPASGDSLDYNRDTMRTASTAAIASCGANQAMPALLKLPGADEQVTLDERWLRGEYEIPEIAGKWTTGPAVAIELESPAEAAFGRAHHHPRDRHLEQGRPRLPDGPARHHPVLGGAPGHGRREDASSTLRAGATSGTSSSPARSCSRPSPSTSTAT